jgi:putative tryptophan/tyrosine transport system substrate-binding protein
MKKLFWLITAFLLVSPHRAEAQQPTKIPRIGYLAATNSSELVFRQGLRDLGYVEGKNIIIEWRSGEGKRERADELAAELVRLKVDVIVTSGQSMTQATKEATSTIPIVMAQDSDPVGNGFVASLAHPGGNVTGLSNLRPELSAKRLELLKEIVHGLSRVAVLASSNEPGNARIVKEIELAAGAFGLHLQVLDVLTSKDIEIAFRAATKAHTDALLEVDSAFLADHRRDIANLALKNRLPAIYGSSRWVELGGLVGYGPSLADLARRAAIYVDKILKGAKPGDLPVEQPEKFELVINLKTAKQIGLTIPPNVLARADRVIR